ncbi:MAG: ABC transporter ATP-binding protein, partial [Sedimentisphaerales bacterium]|nr:ABC transporter ATP-binding protein [Sedimentisphaerales bacterium]
MTEEDKKYAIETLSLTKVFADLWGRDKVYAVNDLSLKIKYNEVFGLLGPNGSGKTTTLKMLLGLLHPTKGKAIVLDGNATDTKISQRIGFMPEESYLYRYLNARETLDFYGRLFGLNSKVRKTRTETLLDMVGLKAVANRAVGTFSKGMARRIGLAQAIINDPDLLILDEPTTGLDPIGTRQIKDLILQLAKRGKTILLCSHLLADVEDVCDRIAILYGGRIQSEGNVRDLLQQSGKTQITTGSLSNQAVNKIKQIVEKEQAQCSVTTPMDKLEAFFIKTVTAAQQQQKDTSGAVSTTQIGDFLAAEPVTESILDKLVSVDMAPRPDAATDSESTKKVETVETTKSKPDETLLSELTSAPEPPRVKPVVKTEIVEPPEPQKGHVKKSVLEQLTDKDLTDTTKTDKADEAGGDKNNE